MSFSVAVGDTIPTPPPPAEPDTLQPGQPPPEEPEEEEEVVEIFVWNYDGYAGFETSESDSTLRWVNMLNLTDRFARRRGGITYRTGTLGRMDWVDYHSYESRHFSAEVNGLQINDPLTGGVNWTRVPIHKITTLEESDFGPIHRTRIRLRDHYLTQPRTYLNFDESANNYRSLEFSATHNLNEKTNIELSFWDRRDGIGYSRSIVEGNQIVFKGYRQISDRWLMRAGYITNSMEQEQSFGYIVDDPQFFDFNPFNAQPVQGGADSEENSKDVYVQFHHRQSIDHDVRTELGLHYQSAERGAQFAQSIPEVEATRDTVRTDFRNVELYGRQHLQFQALEATATARVFTLDNRNQAQLTENWWTGAKGDLDATYSVGSFLSISGNSSFMVRSDDHFDVEYSGRIDIEPIRSVIFSAFGGFSNMSPDIQSLYWQSDGFAGNSDLSNERSLMGGVQAVSGLGSYFSVGARADIREVENGIFVDLMSETEGQFVNIDPYTNQSATAWVDMHSSLFEADLSATYKTFETTNLENPINRGLAETGDRMWLKGSFYWKNYVFDRAAFVKAGMIGTYSPNSVRTADYVTPLNRWQHGTNELINRPFSRVDVDVSARIRWFMLNLRWENIFDRVTQTGYFETVGYPMPPRRFIFGMRILFTN